MDAFATPFAHVDMDAFYVEVERLHDPSLRGVAVVVGGVTNRGVVAAASYEARRHGVRSAMPIVEARRRIPNARFLPSNMERYAAISKRVFAVLDEFSPLVEPLSIDEAFLDISGLRLHFETPRAVGDSIRARISQELALPASVGIASVKFLAKMASKHAKPDGLFIVPAGGERAFLADLPVTELWGVGPATLRAISGLGIVTIGHLAAVPRDVLRRHLGEASAAHLAALAAGEDPRHVTTGRETKSVSVESTFDTDITDRDAVEQALLELCHRLSGRLLHGHHAGRTVTVKVRFSDFATVSRSATLNHNVAETSQLWPVAADLLGRVPIDGRGVRLLGIGVSGLAAGEPAQMALDGSDRTALASVASEVRERFGDDAVLPARLARRPDKKKGG